jgi:hypothetical protein
VHQVSSNILKGFYNALAATFEFRSALLDRGGPSGASRVPSRACLAAILLMAQVVGLGGGSCFLAMPALVRCFGLLAGLAFVERRRKGD